MQERSGKPTPNWDTIRDAVRSLLGRMNPVERQLMVLLTARLHGSGNEVAHPVMILSAPGTGKTTLWTSLMRFTDMLAESSLAPFRMLVVDVQAAVHSIAEVLERIREVSSHTCLTPN